MFIDSPLTPFLAEENSQVIDICYLDNTYCSKQYDSIPTRDKALLEIIKIIELNLKNDKKIVFKCKKLGKETLLVELAKRFKCKILVSNERFNRLIKVLGFSEEYFTNQYDPTIFIEVEDYEKKYSSCLISKFGLEKTCLIEPTALYLNSNTYVSSRQQNPNINVYKVPYSDHSSYSELLEFIINLKPKSVIATVKEIEENKYNLHVINDMKCFDQYLTKKPLVDGLNQYRLILQENTYLRCSERVKFLHGNKINKNYGSLRKNRSLVKSIQYEVLSPVKTKPETKSAISNENWVKLNENVEILNKEMRSEESLEIINDNDEIRMNNTIKAKNPKILASVFELSSDTQPFLISDENNEILIERTESGSTTESVVLNYTIDDFKECSEKEHLYKEILNADKDKENNNQNLTLMARALDSNSGSFNSAQSNNDDSILNFLSGLSRLIPGDKEEKEMYYLQKLLNF
jgi:hypothetical protein